MAIAEDWKNRVVLVGFGSSKVKVLQNPCQEMAFELGDPSLYLGSEECGGPWTVVLGRYLPSVGEPDSRLWLKPDETRRIMIPQDGDFGAMPVHVTVAIEVEGFDDIPIDRKMAEFSNAIADAATNSFGSYRFPFAPSELKNGERFLVKGHPLDHHHRNSPNNRYAYDISVQAYDGTWKGTTTSTTLDPDPDAEPNAKYLAWNRMVRAIASGRVISCRRGAPDNDPNTFANPDANYVLVKHTFDPGDLSREEFVSYVHFRQDSVPLAVCPDMCPVNKPDCNVATDGVDPDGRRLIDSVWVDAGALLGYVGNSGQTSTPHLHVHLTTGAGDGGPVSSGSYPLLLHDVFVESPDWAPGEGPWVEVDGKTIAHGMLVVPTQ